MHFLQNQIKQFWMVVWLVFKNKWFYILLIKFLVVLVLLKTIIRFATMMKFTVFIILPLIGYTQALGIGGCTTRTNECKAIPNFHSNKPLCAVLYEEPCCNSGDVHVADGEERTFSTNVFRDDVDASDLLDNKDKEDDIESIIVNANCTLTIYKVIK